MNNSNSNRSDYELSEKETKEKELIKNEINAFDYKQKREEYVNVKFNEETKDIYNLLHDETFYREFLEELLTSITEKKEHFVIITRFLLINPIECIYRFIILLLYDKREIKPTFGLKIDMNSILNPILNIIDTLKSILGSSAIKKLKGILEDTKTLGVGGIYNIMNNDGPPIKPFLLKLIERVVYNIVNSFLDNNMIYEENVNKDIELFIPVLFGIGNFTGSLSVELHGNSEKIAKVIYYYLLQFHKYIIAIRDAQSHEETANKFTHYFPKYETDPPNKDETIEVISKFLDILMQIVYEAIEIVYEPADNYLNVKKDILLKESNVNTGANAVAGVSNTVFKLVGSDIKISKNYDYINRMLSIIEFILCIVSQYTNTDIDKPIDCNPKKVNKSKFIANVVLNTFDKPRQLQFHYGSDIVFLTSKVSAIGFMNSPKNIDLIKNTLKYEHKHIRKIAKSILTERNPDKKKEYYKELINRYFTTVIIFISQFLEKNKYMIARSYTEKIKNIVSKTAMKGVKTSASAVGKTAMNTLRSSSNLVTKGVSRIPYPTKYMTISSPFSNDTSNPNVNNPNPKVKTNGGKKTRKNKRRMITRKHRHINHTKTRCNMRKNSRK